jgi:hypothetical protein
MKLTSQLSSQLSKQGHHKTNIPSDVSFSTHFAVCLPGWGTSTSNPQACSRAAVDQWAPGGPKIAAITAIQNCPEGTATNMELGSGQAGSDNDDRSDCKCKSKITERAWESSLIPAPFHPDVVDACWAARLMLVAPCHALLQHHFSP